MAAPSDPVKNGGVPEPSAAPEDSGPEISTRRIEIVNAGLVLATALASYVFWTPASAWGVLMGGALSGASFRVIAAVMKAIFAKGSTSFWPVATFWLKYAAMMGAVGILVLIYRIDAIGLLVGLSLLLPAIVLEAVLKLVWNPS